MSDDLQWQLLRTRTGIAVTAAGLAFIGWGIRRWWKHALDFQIAVAGDE